MIKGGFCSAGRGAATLCSIKLKSVQNVQVPKDHLIPSMEFFFPECEGMFHDNAKIHRAKIVKDWFQEQKSSFAHLKWPSQSPNMENCG